MKEFDMRERRSAIFLLGMMGVLSALYIFIVPEVLIIRVFRKFVPIMWLVFVVLFCLSLALYRKDREALAKENPDNVLNINTPITSLSGVYKNMLSWINILNVFTVICIAIAIVGYFYQYKNSAVFEYYPLVMTVLCVVLDVAVTIVFTREGRATKYDKDVIKLVKETEQWEKKLESDSELIAVDEEETEDNSEISADTVPDMDFGYISIDE